MQHAALLQCGHNRCHYNQQLHWNISTIYPNYLNYHSVSIDAPWIMFGFVGTSNRLAANVSITTHAATLTREENKKCPTHGGWEQWSWEVGRSVHENARISLKHTLLSACWCWWQPHKISSVTMSAAGVECALCAMRGLRGDCWVSLCSSVRAADGRTQARGGGAPVEITSDGPNT